MAFVPGSVTVQQISDTCFRVTGTILDSAGSGTIGFEGRTASPAADVSIDAKNWEKYVFNGATISLIQLVKVSVCPTGFSVGTAAPGVTKTGTTFQDFLITLRNNNPSNSLNLEAFIELASR